MVLRTAFIVFLSLVLTGCVGLGGPPKPMNTPFDEADYARYTNAGTGSVEGQVFLKTRGGDVKFGAGNVVELAPVTPYTSEIFTRSVIGNENLKTDARLAEYVRKTTADGEGRFEFTNVPPGNYYVVGAVYWEVPVSQYSSQHQGGRVGKEVSLAPGERKRVIVTE